MYIFSVDPCVKKMGLIKTRGGRCNKPPNWANISVCGFSSMANHKWEDLEVLVVVCVSLSHMIAETVAVGVGH